MTLEPKCNKHDIEEIKSHGKWGETLISSVEDGDTLIKVSEPSQNMLNYLSANDYKLVSTIQTGYMDESNGMSYDCLFRKEKLLFFPNFGDCEASLDKDIVTPTGRIFKQHGVKTGRMRTTDENLQDKGSDSRKDTNEIIQGKSRIITDFLNEVSRVSKDTGIEIGFGSHLYYSNNGEYVGTLNGTNDFGKYNISIDPDFTKDETNTCNNCGKEIPDGKVMCPDCEHLQDVIDPRD